MGQVEVLSGPERRRRWSAEEKRWPFKGLRHERRAGTGRGLFDEALQRIADVLGRVDGGGDNFQKKSHRLTSATMAARRGVSDQRDSASDGRMDRAAIC